MIFYSLVVPAFFYFLLSSQVYSGFPPFYKRDSGIKLARAEDEEFQTSFNATLRAVVPLVAGVGMAHWTGYSAFCLVGVASLLWAAWSLRSRLAQETGGPLPWMLIYMASPFIFSVFENRPMLVFDVWTIGFSGAIAIMMIAFGYY